jgi:hypothetical protein
LERIGEAIRETAKEVQSYTKQHPEFAEIGRRLPQEWESGSATSLRGLTPLPSFPVLICGLAEKA